jgi:RHH-type rel operon transcriptional repressor/antitoxin RelB
MLELRLEPEVEALLEELASKTGQTKAEFARRAILDRLEDWEDYEIGVAALRESGGKGAIPFEEVVKSLGMEVEFSPEGAKATAKPGRSRTKANSELPTRKTSRIA